MNFEKFLTSKAALVIMTSAGFVVAFSSPASALISNVYTMVGDYIITGTLQVNSLAPGGCVTASSAGKLSATGSACGGGGGSVASVTSASPNLSAAPTTGAVVLNFLEDPTFTGPVSALSLAATDLTSGDCVEASAGGVLITTGFSCASSGGVTAVTASGNLASSGGTTPNITISGSPTFAGNTTVGSLTSAGAANVGSVNATGAVSGATLLGTGLTSGRCVQTSAGGLLTTTGSACAGAGVNSVTAGPSGNITVSPTTGAVIVDEITNPTFTGTLTAGNLLTGGSMTSGSVSTALIQDTGLTSGQCLQANGTHTIVSTGSACGTGTGTVTSVTGTANQIAVASGTTTPVISIVTNPILPGNASASGTFTATSLTATGLTSGDCLQASVGGLITNTGSPCGSGTGTVTAVTATGNLASSGGTTPNITITGSPTFAGLVTSDNAFQVINSGGGYTDGTGPGGAGLVVSCGSVCNQPQAILWSTNAGAGLGAFIGGDSTKTTQGVPDTYFQFGENNNGTPVIGTAIDPVTGAIGTTGPISSGSLVAGQCLEATTGGVITSTGAACGATSGNPALGSTSSSFAYTLGTPVTVNTVTPVTLLQGTPITITTTATNNTLSGSVYATVISATSFTFMPMYAPLGASPMPSGASILPGSAILPYSGVPLVGGQCVEGSPGISGTLTSTGAACASAPAGGFGIPQIAHGNQVITATAATCVTGTPVVFAHTFTTAPDIVGSTSPVTGDTFAPSAITTTGFTPELCSVASTAAVTIYWTATN